MSATVTRAIPFVLAAAVAGGCATGSIARFVWVDQYEAPPTTERGTIIRPGDSVDVRVLGQDQFSAKVRVRSDGYVTLPFVGDLVAAGRTPTALGELVQEKVREYVNSPVVAVNLEEAPPGPISVMGEVARPGQQAFTAGIGILDALAQAGGLTPYAHKDRVFVLRNQPTVRIRFDIDRLVRGEGKGPTFVLDPGDIIVVE
jgi:polysaccharide export outer membrane protein